MATTSSTITTDYVDLLLSANGDLILTDGDLTLATDNSHSLVQRLRMRLNIWQTEWIYNQSFGMPYLQYIGKGITQTMPSDIANKIKTDIINLEIIPSNLFDVYALKDGNTIQIRVILFENDDYTIRLSYDPSVGVTLGH